MIDVAIPSNGMVFHGGKVITSMPVPAGFPNGATRRYSHAGRRMIPLLSAVLAVLALVVVSGFFSYLEHKELSNCQTTTSSVEKNRTENNGKVYSDCSTSRG